MYFKVRVSFFFFEILQNLRALTLNNDSKRYALTSLCDLTI